LHHLETDAGEFLERSGLVLLADEEIDVVIAGVPSVRVHREAAAEGERDLGLFEHGRYPFQRVDQAFVHPVRHGIPLRRSVCVCQFDDYPSGRAFTLAAARAKDEIND
jgi:hypothetical protein